MLEGHLIEGESQSAEFKEKLPDNIRDLAENIASFATSNSGTIYIGIDKTGNVVGIDLPDAKSKDDFQQRIVGIANIVKPAIRVSLNFIKKDGKTIVKINVPKGFKPVYYVGGIPYLRDLSSSRKAEPSEVEELHLATFQLSGFKQEAGEDQKFLARALSNISSAKLALSDMEEHNVNPYLDQLRYDLGIRGSILFESSAEPIAKELGLNDKLKELGKMLMDMETFQFYLGPESWNKFKDLGKKASTVIDEIIPEIEKKAVRQEKYIPEFTKALEFLTNKFSNQWELAKTYRLGSEFDTWRDELRRYAYNFIEYAFMLDPTLYSQQRQKLIDLAEKIRSLATPRIFGYGTIGHNPISMMSDDMKQCIESTQEIIDIMKK